MSTNTKLAEALRDLYQVVHESMGTGGWTPTALHGSLVHAMIDAREALAAHDAEQAKEPIWDAGAEAMRWLNKVELCQGGANGPSIKLRAAILALLPPPEQAAQAVPAGYVGPAALEWLGKAQSPDAYITTSLRKCQGETASLAIYTHPPAAPAPEAPQIDPVATMRALGFCFAIDDDLRQKADKIASALQGGRVNYQIEQEAAALIWSMRDALAAAPAPEAERPHLFELWWARYMPNATQAEAWEAWQAAPRADGVGVIAPRAQAAGRDERERFKSWWRGLNSTPYYEGIQEAIAWNAWQARAALAQRQPLTEQQIMVGWRGLCPPSAALDVFTDGVVFAERAHGIGGATTGEQQR